MSAPKSKFAYRPADPDMSEEAMDRLLAGRHAEIETKLQVARDEPARGDTAPLEPLEDVLRDAHARFDVKR